MAIIDRLRRALDYLESPELIRARRRGVRVDFVAELVDLRKRFGIRPATVVDVGANAGAFVRAAQFVHPAARVFAFEPIPELAQRLRRDLGSDRCEIFECALDDRDGSIELFVPSAQDLSSLLQPTGQLFERFGVEEGAAASVTVATRRLDGILNLVDSPRPVLLKIDVQGGELRVLRGCEGQIHAVDCIRLEFSFDAFYEGQAGLVDLFAYLTAHGFRRFIQVGTVVSDGRVRWCDFVFFRDDPTGK